MMEKRFSSEHKNHALIGKVIFNVPNVVCNFTSINVYYCISSHFLICGLRSVMRELYLKKRSFFTKQNHYILVIDGNYILMA